MKILLGRDDGNPDSRDTTGRTLLSNAAYSGQKGIVKILLAGAYSLATPLP